MESICLRVAWVRPAGTLRRILAFTLLFSFLTATTQATAAPAREFPKRRPSTVGRSAAVGLPAMLDDGAQAERGVPDPEIPDFGDYPYVSPTPYYGRNAKDSFVTTLGAGGKFFFDAVAGERITLRFNGRSLVFPERSGSAPVTLRRPDGSVVTTFQNQLTNVDVTLSQSGTFTLDVGAVSAGFSNQPVSLDVLRPTESTLDAADPFYIPPSPFASGAGCSPQGSSVCRRYEVYEYLATSGGSIAARMTSGFEGQVSIYRTIDPDAPDTRMIAPFAPEGCAASDGGTAIASSTGVCVDTGCTEYQANATGSVGPGYFYVVVSRDDPGTETRAFALDVTVNGQPAFGRDVTWGNYDNSAFNYLVQGAPYGPENIFVQSCGQTLSFAKFEPLRLGITSTGNRCVRPPASARRVCGGGIGSRRPVGDDGDANSTEIYGYFGYDIENEPNNAPATPDPLRSEEVFGAVQSSDPGSTGGFDGDDIEDWYELTVGAPGVYAIDLSDFGATDLDLFLYSASGPFAPANALGSSGFTAGDAEHIRVSLTSGRYLIGVTAYGNDVATETSYLLTAAPIQQSESEANDGPSTADFIFRNLTENEAQRESVTGSAKSSDAGSPGGLQGDAIEDWYQFSASQGERIVVDLSGFSPNSQSQIDFDLYVFRSTGPFDGASAIGRSTLAPGRPERIVLQNLAAGTYVVGVSAFTGQVPNDTPYTLSLLTFNQPAIATCQDLELDMDAAPTMVQAGSTITYTLTATLNSAPPLAILQNPTITHRLPQGTTLVSCNPGVGGSFSNANGVVTIRLSPMAAKFGPRTVTVTAQVASPAPSTRLLESTGQFSGASPECFAHDAITGTLTHLEASTAPPPPPPAMTPAAPSNLFVIKIKRKKVTFGWTDNATNETRYEILIRNGQAWNVLGSLSANATIVTVFRLARMTTYTFGVRACNADGCSDIAEIAVRTK